MGKKTLFVLVAFFLLSLPLNIFQEDEAIFLETSVLTKPTVKRMKAVEPAEESKKQTTTSLDPLKFWKLLKENQISFENIDSVLQQASFTPTKYTFSHAIRTLRIEDDVYQKEVSFLEPPLPQDFFEKAEMPSSLDLFLYEKAVPAKVDQNLLLNIIQPLLISSRLKLLFVEFPGSPAHFKDAPLTTFLFRLETEGLLSDHFAFLKAIQKHSRFMTIEEFEIEVTDIRSYIPIGNMKITLAAYSRK